MNDLAVRRNVTSRLEELEDSAAALVIRADALLQAGKALTGQVNRLEDRVQAIDNELHDINVAIVSAGLARRVFERMTFLQRLNWLVRGV